MNHPEEILDIPEKPEIDFSVLIRWWETRRILYNIILIACEILLIELIPNGVLRWGFSKVILFSVAFTLCANACYTLGFGSTILRLYYSRKTDIQSNLRLLSFILGLIFSIFITFILFGKFLDVEEI